MPTPYSHAIARALKDVIGDRVSVFTFGAVGDGVTDDSAAINAALSDIASRGGGDLYFPGGSTYAVALPIQITVPDVRFIGDGDSSVILRTGAMATGKGVIDVTAAGFTLEMLKIDGAVTTSVGLQYNDLTHTGDFNNDPMHSALTANTSVWVHGVSRPRFRGVTITHTGGYAILLDAYNADIIDALIESCLFENNRPNLFGLYGSGDLNYGSWNGGVFAAGDCRSSASKLFAVRGLRVKGNRWNRSNGNCLWSHSLGFDTHHENFVVTGNEYSYIARDCYEPGNVKGGGAFGNSARYVGFRHATDNDTPVGAYLSNSYAVAFDSTGWVENHPFIGNTVVEFYGGAFDLDGLRNSSVSDNSMASTQAVAKGIQTGDTSGNGGGYKVNISGNTIKGCNAGAIVLNQASQCLCESNVIDHPAGAAVVPILLYSLNKQTNGTTVRGNDIYYPASQWAIAESDGGSGTGFDSSVINYIYGNRINGALGEFLKISASSSRTGISLSTNDSTATVKQEVMLQREGSGASAALKLYDTQNATRKQHMQVQFSNSLLNMSANGAAQTGIITTGARSTLGFSDAVWTGKQMSDGFLAVYDSAGSATSYLSADANALTNDWGLLRFDKATTEFKMSVSTSAGSRVWVSLSGGGSGITGLTTGRVPFAASSTTLADDAALTWDNTAKTLKVSSAGLMYVGATSDDGSGGKLQVTGYVSASTGYYSAGSALDTVKVLSGGVTAKYLIGNTSLTMVAETAANAGLSATGQGRLYFDSTSHKVRLSENGGAYVDISPAGLNSAGTVRINTSTDDGSGANLQVNGFVSASTGYYSGGTATDTVKIPSGGVTAKYLIGTTSLTLVGETAGNAGLSAAGQGRLYFDSSTNKFRVSQNGGAYVDLVGSSSGLTSVNSMTGPALSIAGSGAISISNASNTVTITNTGVTSLTGGTAISVSASTGSITVTNTGVTSLAAGTGVSLSGSTGGVTVSIGQPVGTSANVTFASVTTTGVVQSSASGGSISFQNSNGNFQVDGNGNVSAAGSYNTNTGYRVGGSTVINSSHQFIGSGVLCQSNGIGGGGFNPWNGASYDTGATGTINVLITTSITVKGGVIIGWA